MAGESRVNVEGGKFWYTGNPEGPTHWAKTDYVDRCEGGSDETADFNGVHYGFEVSDNPRGDPDYMTQLHMTYSGAMLRRMAYGEWAATSGAIYPDFAKQNISLPPKVPPSQYAVVFDDAPAKITIAALFARYPQGWWAIDEWWHDGRESGKTAPTWKARQFISRFTPEKRHISRWIGDPAAQNLRSAVEMEGRSMLGVPVRVTEAENDVLPGIQLTDSWLRMGRVNVSPECRKIVEQMTAYHWDEDAAARGDDRPVKLNDDGCDVVRYLCYTLSGQKHATRAPRAYTPKGAVRVA